jgi:hypothetical protein
VTPSAPPASELMLQGITSAQRLIRALALHGIVLPQVRGSYPARGTGQVDLGSCPAADAQALAAVLEEHAGPTEPGPAARRGPDGS